MCKREDTGVVLSGSPRRGGLKQQWHAELKSSVQDQQWHPRSLGNAIQTLQRSIVRKTVVRGKRKVFCTILNCFQIPPLRPRTHTQFFFLGASYYQSRVQTVTVFLQNHTFLCEVLKCKMSGRCAKLKHDPLPCRVIYFVLVTYVKSLLLSTFIAQEVKLWDGKWPYISYNRPHSTVVHIIASCGFCQRNTV